MDIDFYFDFISPYAYFAWKNLTALREQNKNIVIKPKPVVFGAILTKLGQKGPAEIPSKRRYTIRDCMRYAKQKKNRFRFLAETSV